MLLKPNQQPNSITGPDLIPLEETSYQIVKNPIEHEQNIVASKTANELVIEVAQALANKAAVKSPQIVKAYEGVVTLRGEVESEEGLDRAEAVVMAVGGVVGVINGLTVKLKLASPVDSSQNPFDFQPRNSFHSSREYLPVGEIALVENVAVYATNGKVGLVKGLIFLRGEGEGKVQYLIVETRKALLKSWRRLPFEYVIGGYDNPYTSPDPDIYLNLSRADFESLAQLLEQPKKDGQTTQPEQSIFFGEKTLVRDQVKKLGWLSGVLLDRAGYSQTLNPSLSHYLLKTGAFPKTRLLPFEALEVSSKEQALDLKSDLAATLLSQPYQFNGFASPTLVVERVLEKLALSRLVQQQGSCLRVTYHQGEITLKGVLVRNFRTHDLMVLVEAVAGVRRVNNQVEATL